MYDNNHEQFLMLNLVSSAVHLAIRLTKLLPQYDQEWANLEGCQIHKLTSVFSGLTFLLVSLIQHQSLINYIFSTLAQFLEFAPDVLIAIFVSFTGKHKMTVLFDSVWFCTMEHIFKFHMHVYN